MKKNYDTRLLFIGIYLLLAQIASFTLQDYFGHAHLTLVPGLDIAINFLIAFFLIAQFKRVHQAVSIVIIIYSGINLFYAFIARESTIRLFENVNLSVFFVLALLLGYALFAIAAIFLLIHTTQKRFESDFSIKIISTSLLTTFALLITAGILVTNPKVTDIITLAFTLLSLLALFIAMYFIAKSETIEYDSHRPQKKESNELERLYKQGLITEEEYNKRKASKIS